MLYSRSDPEHASRDGACPWSHSLAMGTTGTLCGCALSVQLAT
jgi:hypothetical protein